MKTVAIFLLSLLTFTADSLAQAGLVFHDQNRSRHKVTLKGD